MSGNDTSTNKNGIDSTDMNINVTRKSIDKETDVGTNAPEVYCKGSITLGSGCRKCKKCIAEAYQLADYYIMDERERNSPESKKNVYIMEQAGTIMSHALRMQQNDLLGALTIIKIAASGIETIVQMEQLRKVMSYSTSNTSNH